MLIWKVKRNKSNSKMQTKTLAFTTILQLFESAFIFLRKVSQRGVCDKGTER